VPTKPYKYRVHEYVWDRVRQGPAIVVGVLGGTNRLTVAEIVLPDRKLGRVAHRRPSELSRYVHMLVPEDEAEAAEVVLGGLVKRRGVGLIPDRLLDPLSAFTKRIKEAREERGIIHTPDPQ
jgi:hypothetical protein